MKKRFLPVCTQKRSSLEREALRIALELLTRRQNKNSLLK